MNALKYATTFCPVPATPSGDIPTNHQTELCWVYGTPLTVGNPHLSLRAHSAKRSSRGVHLTKESKAARVKFKHGLLHCLEWMQKMLKEGGVPAFGPSAPAAEM